MDRSYYEKYHELEKGHWWFRARKEILEDLLQRDILPRLRENPKILNAGAATGVSSLMLSEYGALTSLELDQSSCDFMKEEYDLDVVCSGLEKTPFPDKHFDLICAFDVIEHIKDHEQSVKEMKRILKPGGKIFLTVPAFQFLWSDHDEINHHFRRYTLKNIRALIKKEELEIQRSSYFNTILFPPIALTRILGKIRPYKTLKSDFERYNTDGIGNKILFGIFRLEKKMFRFISGFPFGVSIFLIVDKKEGR